MLAATLHRQSMRRCKKESKMAYRGRKEKEEGRGGHWEVFGNVQDLFSSPCIVITYGRNLKGKEDRSGEGGGKGKGEGKKI